MKLQFSKWKLKIDILLENANIDILRPLSQGLLVPHPTTPATWVGPSLLRSGLLSLPCISYVQTVPHMPCPGSSRRRKQGQHLQPNQSKQQQQQNHKLATSPPKKARSFISWCKVVSCSGLSVSLHIHSQTCWEAVSHQGEIYLNGEMLPGYFFFKFFIFLQLNVYNKIFHFGQLFTIAFPPHPW